MTRNKVAVLVQALVSVGLLTLLFRGLDMAVLQALFVSLPVWYYLLSLFVVVAGIVLYAWRWQQLLIAAHIKVPFGAVLRQYFIGLFLNNFFPSTVGGDMAKVYYLGREHGYRAITASVVLDRMLGLGMLAIVAAALHWTIPDPPPPLAAARIAVTAIALAVIAAFVLAACGTGGLPQRLSRFGATAVAVASHLHRFRLDMAGVLHSPRILGVAIGVVATYFVAVTAVYGQFFSLNSGAEPPFMLLLTSIATVSLLSNLPAALNGLGLREQLHVLLLRPLGVPREAAVAISLLLFAHVLVASLAGFFLWLRVPPVPAGAIEESQT